MFVYLGPGTQSMRRARIEGRRLLGLSKDGDVQRGETDNAHGSRPGQGDRSEKMKRKDGGRGDIKL